MRGTYAYVALIVALLTTVQQSRAEKYSLKESIPEQRTYVVSSGMSVSGNLKTPTGGGKSFSLKLDVSGQFQFHSRRLPSAGRDAAAMRAVREYAIAKANIKVNDRTTTSQLPQRRRIIVAHGRRDGAVLYSPKELLNSDELELLKTPGDCLSIVALLPQNEVEVGDSWNPPSWVLQMMTGVEATLKSELTCKLDSVSNNVAKIRFDGSIEGAVLGANTKLAVTGACIFDIKQAFVSEWEIQQTEKRDVGAVSPGIDVTAKVRSRRAVTSKRPALPDGLIDSIPLDPPAQATLLRFDSPWNIQFSFGRDWHVFHQTTEVAVLRLLHQGGLLAQCNVSQVPSVGPGEHTPESQFQADVRAALGTRFERIQRAEQIKTDDRRYLYRVTAVGKSNNIPMTWFYYICASPEGRQLALSFAVETKQLETFANRDLDLVQRIKFLPRRVSTQPK